MRENPYNPAPKRQLANVQFKSPKGEKANYAVVCYDNDTEEVLHFKASKKAVEDFGSEAHSPKVEFKTISREDYED